MTFDFKLLDGVAKPGRYLNREFNAVYKLPDADGLRLALAFPDLYEIGMSNYGFLLLYQLLNQRPEFFCERVFAPAADFADNLRRQDKALFSLETSTPLKDFDILGFSLSYEMAYSNVLLMLELAGIPWEATERGDEYPLLLAGGPTMVNPEPVAPLFDAILVGDGEEAVIEIASAVLQARRESLPRHELLGRLAAIEGLYVPSFFVSDSAFQLRPQRSGYERIERRICRRLNDLPLPVAPPVPLIQVVHDRLALEISRGCSRGCRFCQAGMIYRPVREQPKEKLLQAAAAGAEVTGFDELSLLSLSVGDYRGLYDLVREMPAGCPDLELSLPSVRAGALSDELLAALQRRRQGGFTIAPEAGSQRLREVINKNLSEEEILATVERLFARGWDLIKLYFMIGLPTETDADLLALVDLCRRALQRAKSKRQRLNVSVSTFIPKPHTPFQWETQIGPAETRRRQELIREGLRGLNCGRRLNFKWHDSRVSLLEGVFSRGDRRLWPVLKQARLLGCSFDAWSDHFDFALWQQAFAAEGLDPEKLAAREFLPGEVLPWGHIDCYVSNDFLLREREKSRLGSSTPDCRTDGCRGCGVCSAAEIADLDTTRTAAGSRDGKSLEPVEALKPGPAGAAPVAVERREWRYQVEFSRSRRLAFLSHLETVAVIARGLRRQKVPLAYSQGFHPHPKISFAHALPLGLASRHEAMEIRTLNALDENQFASGWGAALPSELKFIRLSPVAAAAAAVDWRLKASVYLVRAEDEAAMSLLRSIGAAAGEVLAGERKLEMERHKKAKRQVIDLTPHLVGCKTPAAAEVQLEIAVLAGRNPNIFDILRILAGLDERPGGELAVEKIASILD